VPKVYISSEDVQCAIDLDSSNEELRWFKPWRTVEPIDVEIKEL
jgi:hypothetical protein